VYGESMMSSIGAGAGGCVHNATFIEAAEVCMADGGRLCSVAELEADCTAGTGCMHDYDLIRSSEACTPAISTPSGVSPTIPPYAQLVSGNGQTLATNPAECTAADELHELRCCSDLPRPGYTNWRSQAAACSGIWVESVFRTVGGDGCVHQATYAESLAICAADGARMCTAAEMAGGCTANTGCGHNSDLIRVADSCATPTPGGTGSGPPPPPPSNNPCGGRSCGAGAHCTPQRPYTSNVYVCSCLPAYTGASTTNAPATCTMIDLAVNARCNTIAQFQQYATIVTQRCCDEPNERCDGPTGLPSVCNPDCAMVLVPMQRKCSTGRGYLRTNAAVSGFGPIIADLQNAVATCTTAGYGPGGGGGGGQH
jgi:hypothetical protein